MDQFQFLLAAGAAFAVVVGPILISVIVMSREASIELPMPLLYNDPEPGKGIAEGDLDPWRIHLVRPRRADAANGKIAAEGGTAERRARETRPCELAPAP